MFKDRVDAGRQLAKALQGLRPNGPLVLAIPRGGVVVGCEVARILHAKLDIVVPRKLRAPGAPEVAIGAVMPDGSMLLNIGAAEILGVSDAYLEKEEVFQIRESERRMHAYRDDRQYPQLHGKTVIIVDDGIATGATMIVALRWAKAQKTLKIIAASPVVPAEVIASIRKEADEIVCLEVPEPFLAVGLSYENFDPVEDGQVMSILNDFWSGSKDRSAKQN